MSATISTITSTSNNNGNNTASTTITTINNKPLYVGQIVRANIHIGEVKEGNQMGYPYYPGLLIEGIGYREFFYPECGVRRQELAGVVTRIPDWGFKSPVQFRVAKRLANYFGHLWAQPTMVTVRKPQPNGTVKLVEEPVEPSTPWEAALWANDKYDRDAMFQIPTPKWESGSGTYKVTVHNDGRYTIITNAILQETFSPNGQRISASTVPGWHAVDFTWKWEAKTHNGRGQNLQESVKLAIKKGGEVDLSLLELFESDRNFWRTGFVAGTRWYE